MATTPTKLQDLISRVRTRTNTENNQVVTDAELTIYLNSSLSALDDMLVNQYQDYKLKTYEATITDTANNNFALPADFYKGRGLDRKVVGVWMTLQTYQQPKRNMYSFPIVNYVYGYLDVFYRLRDQLIEIIPAQNCAATYRLWYIPEYVPLVNGTDTLQPYMDTQAWCEYGVVDTCIDVLMKQDLPTEAFERKKADLQARIMQSAAPRDAGPAKRVQNTRFSQDWQGPGYDWNF